MYKLLLVLTLLIGYNLAFSQTLPPAQPSNVTASQIALENRLKVDWTAPSGTFNGYKIYYNVKGATRIDSIKVGVVTTHNLTNLTLDTVYNVRMRSFRTVTNATTSKTDTLYSAAYTTTINAIVATLVKPTISIDPAFVTYNSLILRVKDTNKYETGFEIEVEENGFTKALVVNKAGSDFQETISGLKASTDYKFRVRAKKGENFGPWSDPLSFKTAVGLPPQAILKVEGNNCPYEASFSWTIVTRSDEISEMTVWRSINGNQFAEIGTIPVAQRNYIDTKAEPGINYQYRIITKNSSGTTDSNPIYINVKPYTAPSLPINIKSLQNIKTHEFLTISWEHGPEDNVCKTNTLVSTEVAISVRGEQMRTIANLSNWVTIYKIDGFKAKDPVEIFFRTHSDKGLISNWTSIKDTTYGPADPPQNFIGVVGKDHFGDNVLYLSWDKSVGADSYLLEKSTDGINFYTYTHLTSNYNQITDLQIQEGVNYFYRVLADHWTGKSDYSRIIGPFTFNYSKRPNAPYGLTFKKQSDGVEINWVDDSNNEQNFVLEKSINGNTFSKIAEPARNNSTYKDEDLSAGRTYQYRVKAVNPIGESAYSKVGSITIDGAATAATYGVTVFPNPLAETLNLKVDGIESLSKHSLKIFDQNNRLVVDKEITFDLDGTSKLPISSLPTGMYNMTLTGEKGVISKKLVKL